MVERAAVKLSKIIDILEKEVSTADEDLSFNEGNKTSDKRDDIFNNSIRDDNIKLRDQRKTIAGSWA